MTALVLLASSQTKAPRLIWNASASVPIGFYLVRAERLRRGDIALARLPARTAEFALRRGYLRATPYVLKPVVAVSGDRVCRIGDRVTVRGRAAAVAQRRDLQHRALPVWQGCRSLAAGEIFLLTDDVRSFDSRYFGPIAADNVGGRATAVWQVRVGNRCTPPRN